MIHKGDNVVVMNLRQVVTVQNPAATNPSSMERCQSCRQALGDPEAMVEDAIETMVVMPRGPQVTFSPVAQTKDTTSTTSHGMDDLEYGHASSQRQLVPSSSLRTSSHGPAASAVAAATTTTRALGDYSKYEKPSKLRTSILITVGILLMLGGIVWAIVHVAQSPDYVTTSTGQPTGAVLCSNIEQELTQILQDTARHNNDTDLAPSYAARYQEQCHVLPDRALPCTLAVSYMFTTSSSSEVEVGFATLPFDSGHNCHETVDASRQAFLQSTNVTIYYNDNNPSDNYYQPPPEARTVAGIIAGVSCAVGILFVCVSLLERILI